MIDLWREKDRLIVCLRAAEWNNPEVAADRIIEQGERIYNGGDPLAFLLTIAALMRAEQEWLAREGEQ